MKKFLKYITWFIFSLFNDTDIEIENQRMYKTRIKIYIFSSKREVSYGKIF